MTRTLYLISFLLLFNASKCTQYKTLEECKKDCKTGCFEVPDKGYYYCGASECSSECACDEVCKRSERFCNQCRHLCISCEVSHK